MSLTPGKRIGKARRALTPRGVRGMLPWKSLKFYSRRDVFSCILKLQTMTFKVLVKEEMRLIFKYGTVGPRGLNQDFSFT